MKQVLGQLGNRLRAIRKRLGLSQDDLARNSGFTREYIARLELGQHDPSFTALLRIANALSIGVDGLLEQPPGVENTEVQMNARQKWDKEVEDKVKTIESVLPWLRKIENDPDRYFEWDSQKSAHQALRYIELAAWEMWNLQYYKNKKQQKLAKLAFEELSSDDN